jgi:hypothetical protein
MVRDEARAVELAAERLRDSRAIKAIEVREKGLVVSRLERDKPANLSPRHEPPDYLEPGPAKSVRSAMEVPAGEGSESADP